MLLAAENENHHILQGRQRWPFLDNELRERRVLTHITRVLTLNGFRKKVVKLGKISCLSIGSNAFDRDTMISVSRLPLMLVRVLSAVVIVQFTFTFYSTFRLDCLDDIRNKDEEAVKSFIIAVSHHRQLFVAFAIASCRCAKSSRMYDVSKIDYMRISSYIVFPPRRRLDKRRSVESHTRRFSCIPT